ncbi:alpha-ketoacid dehydrogenase subunit beta [Candidatus Latescibacterota bacterium]
MGSRTKSYGECILEGFQYLLSTYPEVFVIGQGLWSPWYVGTTMQDLDKEFGVERIIDSPVSEQAVTGMAVGASLYGYRPVVVHPRMDFMILATDQIVNQAAKWGHMLGGACYPNVTIRGIINRGGEQGAQHSQALHAWYAHVPGLRVVMPARPQDARDLLIASVLCDDPVVYVDDRWLYEVEEEVTDAEELPLAEQRPLVLRSGGDVTVVGCGYSTQLALEAAERARVLGLELEVIDLRVINPLEIDPVVESVRRTGRLCAVDGGWRTCGMAGEVLASVAERVDPALMKARSRRVTLVDAPAPTSRPLEAAYYPSVDQLVAACEGAVKE